MLGQSGTRGGSLGLGLDWGCGQYVCSWTDCWPKLCHGSALIKSLNIDANCKCNAISLTVACNVVASAIYHQREFVARDFCVAIRHKRKLCEVVWIILSQYFCASHQKRMKQKKIIILVREIIIKRRAQFTCFCCCCWYCITKLLYNFAEGQITSSEIDNEPSEDSRNLQLNLAKELQVILMLNNEWNGIF